MTERRSSGVGFFVVGMVVLCGLSAPAAARMAAERPTSVQRAQVRLAAGGGHACQIEGDGTVRCWGLNSDGELGDGTTMNRSTPASVSGLFGVVEIAAGLSHTCALLADGTVRCWGDDTFGELGDGTLTTTPRTRPVAVSGLSGAVEIAAGGHHTCALLAGGSVRCWGFNGSGQLGDGTTTDRGLPVSVSGLSGALQITAGRDDTCALLAGRMGAACWGNNSAGQLGDWTTTNRSTPVTVSDPLGEPYVEIAAGAYHTCARLPDGGVRCWGFNADGQLGDNTTTTSGIPAGVSGLTGAVAITGGFDHTCAVLADGTARCWGRNDRGQLGDGTSTNRKVPVTVIGLGNAVAIAGGGSHTCAVLANDTARCWGSNGSGELGNGTNSPSSTPTTVAGGGGSVTARAVATGGFHTCAMRADSTVSCWGRNNHGQLGDGTVTNRPSPVSVVGLTGAIQIAAGRAHTCALIVGGTVRCWGRNNLGQLGDGTTTDRTMPVSVSGLGKPAVAIATGGFHTCALLADDTARCWGHNDHGQLGHGTITDHSTTAVSVSGLNDGEDGAVGIAAGGDGDHTCALTAEGNGRCWGRNDNAQLGDGTTTDRSTPVTVSGLTSAVAISPGGTHTCSSLVDGTGRCWGGNDSGQLGDGTTTQQPIPDTVIGLTGAGVLIAGSQQSCALVVAGHADCWGRNNVGQLGDDTTTERQIPVVVKTFVLSLRGSALEDLAGVLQVTTGGDPAQTLVGHSCAVSADGSLRCWGGNFFGEVGDGTTQNNRLTAVVVPSFTLNISPAVVLERGHRVARVTVIATCRMRRTLRVTVKLVQSRSSGKGVGKLRCVGRLRGYPVTVRVQGRRVFEIGSARVGARAVIRYHRRVVGREQWTRNVRLSLCARGRARAHGSCRRTGNRRR